jgi:hypothetical protein
MVKILPFKVILFCKNKTGPLEVTKIKTETMSKNGKNKTNNNIPKSKSNVLFKKRFKLKNITVEDIMKIFLMSYF